LEDSVAWALPKAPERILILAMRNPADWGFVCEGPRVDSPPEGDEVYFRNAIAAVKNVKRKDLSQFKARCLVRLEAASKRLKE
jgi:hypothetical protein